MAYFSNGSEGQDYQARYCAFCWHDRNGDCPVWLAHLLHVGEEGAQDVLDLLIPMEADPQTGLHIWPGECLLFVPNDPIEMVRASAREGRDR